MDVVAPYDHIQPGFETDQLRRWFEDAGLTVELCDVTSRQSHIATCLGRAMVRVRFLEKSSATFIL